MSTIRIACRSTSTRLAGLLASGGRCSPLTFQRPSPHIYLYSWLAGWLYFGTSLAGCLHACTHFPASLHCDFFFMFRDYSRSVDE